VRTAEHPDTLVLGLTSSSSYVCLLLREAVALLVDLSHTSEEARAQRFRGGAVVHINAVCCPDQP
jgi:hypothetical protein